MGDRDYTDLIDKEDAIGVLCNISVNKAKINKM